MYNYDEYDGLGWAEGGIEAITPPLEETLDELNEADADYWLSIVDAAERVLGDEEDGLPAGTDKPSPQTKAKQLQADF